MDSDKKTERESPALDELIRELEMYRQAAEFVRLGRLAVNEAQEESRRLGVANVYFINGRTYYELPNGDYTQTPPPGYQKANGDSAK